MDAKMVNPFLHATLEILKETAEIDFQVGTFYRKKNEMASGDITGIVGVTGSGKGTVAVTFEKNVILHIVSQLFDETYTDIDPMVIDAVGELTNMITGRVVDKLSANGFDLNLSVPAIVHGENHTVAHHTQGPKIAIPFTTGQGKFTVEFSFDKEPVMDDKPSAAVPGWGEPSPE